MPTIRVVTRGSLLARTQTEQVVADLRAAHAGLEVEILELTTKGDVRLDKPLPELGGKGLFTYELEQALLGGDADFAVHSLKDLPTDLPAGLTLGAVPRRAEGRDALVLPAGATPPDGDPLASLPAGATIGTSSPRRVAFLRHRRPDLQFADIRGNLDTRLRKLDEGQYQAIILAAAGLTRLGWQERISALLPLEISVPAPGQGALGIETRADDERIADLLAAIENPATRQAVVAERTFLAALGGGCSTPCGAHAVPAAEGLVLTAGIAAPDGIDALFRTAVAPAAEADRLGRELAEAMLAAGGARLLAG